MTTIDSEATIINTPYADVHKAHINGQKVATICGNPKGHFFQVVTHRSPGAEFWTGFKSFDKAIEWVVQDNVSSSQKTTELL